ncbi:MAG: radical SAM protein [Candidatus Omnitrophica bacterium]|nr:radical SAM protein [Candidatus Omnitrophota bacterium]
MNKPVLSDITLEIINRCQLRCRMCGIGREPVARQLSASAVVAIFQRLSSAFRIRGVSLTGGEPFLHPEIERMLEYFSVWRQGDRGLRVGIYTNGIETGRIARLLEKNCLLWRGMEFGISLDGMETTHDRIRGRGAFRRTLETVQLLAGKYNGFFPAEIKFTITSLNYRELEAVYDLARQHGLRFSPKLVEEGVTNYYHRGGRSGRSGRISIHARQKPALQRMLQTIMARERRSRQRSVDLKLLSLLWRLVEGGKERIVRCDTPARCLFVTSRGEIYPCLYMEPAGTIYNLGSGWAEIGQRRQELAAAGREGRCPGCLAYHGFLKEFNSKYIA